MNVEHASTARTESRERHSYARLQGRWLLLARGLWIALALLLAGAERMSGRARSSLARARLSPVSFWAVRASLDTLYPRRVSRRAGPSHLLASRAFAAKYPAERAWLVRGYQRAGDRCRGPTLPLPTGVQSTRAPADQMGGLRSHCADHRLCSRDCTGSVFPSARLAQFTLSPGSQSGRLLA